jgi:hypothetical protein
MEPLTRTVLITIGLVFCLFFAAASLVAIADAETSFGVVLGILSLGIVAMILLGLIGAMREPPDE